jgi:PAS domain S-box-containing protein
MKVLNDHLEGYTPLYQSEYRLQTPSGEWRWILDRGKVVARDDLGKPLRVAGTYTDITERKAHEREIERLTRLYATLSQINQSITRTQSREGLFQEVCRIAVEYADFKVVWVGWHDRETHAVTHVAYAGDSEGYVAKIRVYADDRPEGRGPIGTCIREGKPCVIDDFTHDVRTLPWHEAAAAHGLRAAAALPIRFNGEVCGAFTVYAGEPDAFQDQEVALLEEIARDISFALDHLQQEQSRRQAEQALRESEARLRLQGAALEAAANAIVITDRDAVIEWANPAFSTLTGYGLDEAIGRTPRELVRSGIHSQAFYQALWQTILSGKVWQGEIVNRRKDGTLYHEDLTITPVADEGGVIRHFVAVKQNITERKRVQAALRESEERLQLAMRGANDGLWDWNLLTDEVYYSPRWKSMLGYTEGELENHLDTWKRLVHPDDREPTLAVVRDLLEGRTDKYEVEFRMRHKDGHHLHILSRAFLVQRTEDGAVRLVGTHVDITERKAAQDRLATLAVRLQASNRELQDFVYIASHDLQEPLRKIQWFGDRLLAKYGAVLTDDGKDYLQRMHGAASRMQTLINDLLTLSRVTTKAEPFAPVDLSRVMWDVLTDLEVRLEQSGGCVEVGELPSAEADPTQMRQLFQNLIGNALKFRRQGEAPVVRVSGQRIESPQRDAHPGIPGTDYWQIRVEDNGVGFDEKYLDRIFQPFQRLHGRGEYEGTGIGLAVCMKIVERHRGTLTARSAAGQGATFIVTLPAHQPREGTDL